MPSSATFTKRGPGRKHRQGRSDKPRLIHKGASSRAMPVEPYDCAVNRRDMRAWQNSTN